MKRIGLSVCALAAVIAAALVAQFTPPPAGAPTAAQVKTALGYTPLSVSANLSDLASASTGRTNLGLGTAATQATGTFAQVANNLSDIATPATALSNLGGAPLASPVFTGTPAAPTPAATTNTTQLASTAFVGSQFVGGSPGTAIAAEICTTVTVLAHSATITSTVLQCNSAQAVAGIYRATVYVDTTSGQSGSGNVDVSVAWNSAGGAKSFVMSTTSLADTTQALTAGGNTIGKRTGAPIVFHHDGTANITYVVTYASTGQFDLYLVLERLL